MIELSNVSKRFGEFQAVKEISLEVRAGEIFGCLGMNGAGKTTTIRMMTGIIHPNSGTIRICGFDTVSEPERAKAVCGYVPDRPYIYNKLTGREFLYFIAELYRMRSEEAEKQIDKLLEEYGLMDWQDELVESYSHGMKQRLTTCGALVHKPRVLILDEPMVGLDPHGSRLLKDSLRRYAAEGMCIFLSTHSLNVAEEIADRLAIIHKGQILTAGTLAQIRSNHGLSQNGLEEIFIELTATTGSFT
ncbi:MAG: ABC transporter ATP-binding protein [Oligoflexia bacterium]|nr:ABC transporter ATP-binding protein [Oligoflexia bacterium]